MTDRAIELLSTSIDSQTLIFADEQWQPNAWQNAGWIITNRYIGNTDPRVSFNDFEATEATPTRIVFRVSKERAINKHWIELSTHYLDSLEEIIVSGGNKEGVKTLISDLERFYHGKARVTKHGGIRVASISPTTAHDPITNHYAQLQSLSVSGVEFQTKPGQFGWKKVDRGSVLLAQAFKGQLAGSVLDLGCGWGYLSMKAAEDDIETLTATDNCAAALVSCHANLESAEFKTSVVASNCADTIEGPFDHIVCNPPFHIGFDHATDLTEQFLKATAERLAAHGQAWWVVNQFVGVATLAPKFFAKHQLIQRKGGFDIWQLSAPKL